MDDKHRESITKTFFNGFAETFDLTCAGTAVRVVRRMVQDTADEEHAFLRQWAALNFSTTDSHLKPSPHSAKLSKRNH